MVGRGSGSAVLACLAYVDLNPIRAKIAATPETSRFTSVFERIQAERERAKGAAGSTSPAVGESSDSTATTKSRSSVPAKSSKRTVRAEWLSPLPLARELSDERRRVHSCRAANKGCLPMTLPDYLRLLDWTGRQLRRDKTTLTVIKAGTAEFRADWSAFGGRATHTISSPETSRRCNTAGNSLGPTIRGLRRIMGGPLFLHRQHDHSED